jgi:prepilin-type N-terminal cleavage/methylation domain-containing protein
MTSRHDHRRGFTFVELIIVIGILAILLSITSGAAFRVIASRRRAVTEETVKKLAVGIKQQWQAAIDMGKEDSMQLTPGLDPQVARANAINNRLGIEFPADLITATNASSLKPSYWVALAPGVTNPLAQQPAAFLTANGVPGPYQSSAALYLALSQARRSQKFEAESALGPAAFQTITSSTSGVTVTFFVDGESPPNPLLFSIVTDSVTGQLSPVITNIDGSIDSRNLTK